jgi:hypothetical protein
MPQVCPHCGAELVPGPDRDWARTSGAYTFTLRNLPVLVCPAGCKVRHLQLMPAFMALLSLGRALSREFPKKKGWFRKRYTCRECGGALLEDGAGKTFDFVAPSDGGPPLEIHVTGTGLSCVSCGKRHFPYPEGRDGQEAITAPIVSALSEEHRG